MFVFAIKTQLEHRFNTQRQLAVESSGAFPWIPFHESRGNTLSTACCLQRMCRLSMRTRCRVYIEVGWSHRSRFALPDIRRDQANCLELPGEGS